MTSQPQYIKTSVIINKIKELEEERYHYLAGELSLIVIDSQIAVLKEILKPQ